MAAPKRPTHEIVHPNLHLAVGGKLQHVEKGTQMILDKGMADRLGAKVKPLGGKKTVDLTDGDDGE